MTTEELTALGLTEEQAKKVFELHGKGLTKAQKEAEDLKTQNQSLQSQLDTANATLDKFKDVDVESIKKDVETYKKKAEDAKEELETKLRTRDQDDWLKGKYDEYGVASPYARKSLSSEIRDEKDGLKWKDGAFLGFDDFMKAAKEKDSGLYKTKEEKEAEDKEKEREENAPFFTAGNDDGGNKSGKAPTPPLIF